MKHLTKNRLIASAALTLSLSAGAQDSFFARSPYIPQVDCIQVQEDSASIAVQSHALLRYSDGRSTEGLLVSYNSPIDGGRIASSTSYEVIRAEREGDRLIVQLDNNKTRGLGAQRRKALLSIDIPAGLSSNAPDTYGARLLVQISGRNVWDKPTQEKIANLVCKLKP